MKQLEESSEEALYESVSGKKPRFWQVRVFGCLAYVPAPPWKHEVIIAERSKEDIPLATVEVARAVHSLKTTKVLLK